MIKPIKGYEESYEIDSAGIVWTLNYKRTGTRRMMKPGIGSHGYFSVMLKDRSHCIHRLVAENFIPNPKNKREVNHINGIKTDNRLENLEWVTTSENSLHSYRIIGRKPRIPSHFGKRLLTAEQVIEIRKLKSNHTYKQIAEMYEVSTGAITGICKRRNWRWL